MALLPLSSYTDLGSSPKFWNLIFTKRHISYLTRVARLLWRQGNHHFCGPFHHHWSKNQCPVQCCQCDDVTSTLCHVRDIALLHPTPRTLHPTPCHAKMQPGNPIGSSVVSKQPDLLTPDTCQLNQETLPHFLRTKLRITTLMLDPASRLWH